MVRNDEATAGAPVYCDYNATAPLRPQALEAMLPWLTDLTGNAASIHQPGRLAAEAVDDARDALAGLLGTRRSEIVFTSGATEANNLALKTLAHSRPRAGIIVTSVEHPAVLRAAEAVADGDHRLTVIGVDSDGLLDLEALALALRSKPGSIVSVMAANNETGVLTDLPAVVAMAHDAGAVVHSDATQLVGRLPIDLSDLEIDLLSLSAHKFGGPQGVGALFVRRGLALEVYPQLHGGGQEGGWRSGTLNVAGIVGAGAAARAAQSGLGAESARVRSIRDELESYLLTNVPHVRRNGHAFKRLPGVSNLSFPGAPADAVLAAMPSIAASDGSACSSGALAVSHVLTAMGYDAERADSAIRFSFGHASVFSDAQLAASATAAAVKKVRSDNGWLAAQTSSSDPLVDMVS